MIILLFFAVPILALDAFCLCGSQKQAIRRSAALLVVSLLVCWAIVGSHNGWIPTGVIPPLLHDSELTLLVAAVSAICSFQVLVTILARRLFDRPSDDSDGQAGNDGRGVI